MLRLLVRLYEASAAPDWLDICQCLMFLDDAPEVAKILHRLLQGSEVRAVAAGAVALVVAVAVQCASMLHACQRGGPRGWRLRCNSEARTARWACTTSPPALTSRPPLLTPCARPPRACCGRCRIPTLPYHFTTTLPPPSQDEELLAYPLSLAIMKAVLPSCIHIFTNLVLRCQRY